MFKSVLCVLTFAGVVTAQVDFISEGIWRMVSIYECVDHESYDIKVDVKKFKCSRTQDAYNATTYLPEDIDDSFSIRAEIKKKTDGGYKTYQEIKDNCFLCFVRKYALENFRQLKKVLNINTGDELMPAGLHEAVKFVFNYCELPDEGIIGDYEVTAILTDKLGKDVSCVGLNLIFTEGRDECEENRERDEC